MSRPRLVSCQAHGRKPWRGDLVCADCGRIYLGTKDGEAFTPDHCPCGALLRPTAGEGRFAARIACRDCAQEITAAAPTRQSIVKTRLPVDVCPSCGTVLDGASGRRPPRPGDFSLCIECGQALRFTDGLGIEAADDDVLKRELLPWQLRQLRGTQDEIRQRGPRGKEPPP